MPTDCFKQAFRIVALDRRGNHSRSKQSRSSVPPKYADPRRFFARLASEIFLTSLQTAFFNNLLDPGQMGFQKFKWTVSESQIEFQSKTYDRLGRSDSIWGAKRGAS